MRDRQRLKESDFVLQFVDKSASSRSTFISIWREVLDNYLVAPFAYRDAVPYIGSHNVTSARALTSRNRNTGRSVLKDPETNQIIDTLSAQGIGLLMPTMDYIQAMPIGFDDEQKARFLGRLLQGVLSSPGVYRTNFTIFKDAFIFGTAIIQIGWETRSRLQVTDKPVVDSQTGFFIGTEPDIGEVVYRDAPLIQQKDIFDFYPDPSGTRIQQNMLGVAHKFRMSKQEARRLGEAGVYDKAQVERAIRGMGEGEETDPNRDMEEKRFRGLANETHDDYGVMTGFEFWGEVPFRPSDGARNRVITVLNGEHVRSHINPYKDGNIPFKEVVLNPLNGRFYGLGIGEVIRFLQDSADNMLMLHTDATDLAARNVLLAGAGFNGDLGRLKKRVPGDVIPVGNIDAVKPVPQDTNVLRDSAQEYQMRKMAMREASGATSPLQAIPSSDRQTATEVNELVRLASQKVELMVGLVERDDYPWIGKTIHSRIRQFLSRDREEILGGERFPVTLDDVDFDADIRFVGARQAQSKFQKAATLKEALNVLGTNPTVIPILRDVVIRYFRDGLDIQDAEQIVDNAIQVIEQQKERAIQLQQQQDQLKGASVRSSNEGFSTPSATTQQQGVALA
jgi:hypothetical protein